MQTKNFNKTCWCCFVIASWLARKFHVHCICNRSGGILVSVLASGEVDRVFEPRLSQIKFYKIGIYCFSTKHAKLRSESKDWLARNQENVSEYI